MLAALIIVFREVLEAALIISVVMVATRRVAGRSLMVWGGVTLGVGAALLVAKLANHLSAAASGTGQELFNAGVMFGVVLLLGWHVIWMARHGRALAGQMKQVGEDVRLGGRSLIALMLVVALAVMREGAEVALFFFGIRADGVSASNLLIGGSAGLLVGVMTGAALYFGMLRIPTATLFKATNGLLILIAAGMAANGINYLSQANWITIAGQPLWNSAALLSEHSFVGMTLHTLVGYEDRPTLLQLSAYITTALLIYTGMKLCQPSNPSQH